MENGMVCVGGGAPLENIIKSIPALTLAFAGLIHYASL